MTKKVRSSNIELLRIISMLLIISFHYCFHSGFVFETLNLQSYIVRIFWFFGELGVNLFILISGYFMVKGKFSFKKLIKIILELNFYYILLMIIASIFHLEGGLTSFSITTPLWLSFNFIFGRYWFATAYILIYILSPFFNKFINSISQKDYKKFLLVTLLLWCVIPTFFGLLKSDSESWLFFNRFIWLVIVYFIGAYMKLYKIKIFDSKKRTIIINILCFSTMVLSIALIYKFRNLLPIFSTLDVSYFWRPNTIPMLILSVSLFQIFVNINIKNSKIINTFASTTFGIYLMHDSFLKYYLWYNTLHSNVHLHSNWSILYILGSTILVFIVGAIIDLIRQFLERITVDKVLDSKLYDKISNNTKKLVNKIETWM